MNYQVDVLAECIALVWGEGKVGAMEIKEAKDIVERLNSNGWRITREDTTDTHVSSGPLQRALGIDGGDGF